MKAMIHRAALTLDVDWAPDWCINLCVELLLEHNVPATFFVTHHTPVLQQLRANPLFELGIHPNFLAGSSHGSDPRGILQYSLELIPEARAMRTHALVQSTHLLNLVADSFPQIDTDVSLLLTFHPPGLQPTDVYFGKSKRRITRLPYFWEDDVYGEVPGADWSASPPDVVHPGLHIFDFHPTYVALNITTMDSYHLLKRKLGARPLFSATPQEFRPYTNEGFGCRTYLENLLKRTDKARFCKISAITAEHREFHS
jgi:hypothetical protein